MDANKRLGFELRKNAMTRTTEEALLLSEIRFWKELIASVTDESRSCESAERMHQALIFAEYRLARLRRDRHSEEGAKPSFNARRWATRWLQ